MSLLVPCLTNSNPNAPLWAGLKNNPVFNGSLVVDGVGQASFEVTSDVNSSTAIITGASTTDVGISVEAVDGGGAIQKSIQILVPNGEPNTINSIGATLAIYSNNSAINIDSRTQTAPPTNGQDITIVSGTGDIIINGTNVQITGTTSVDGDFGTTGDIFQQNFYVTKAVETCDRSAPITTPAINANYNIQTFQTTIANHFYRVSAEISAQCTIAPSPNPYIDFNFTDGGEGTCIAFSVTQGMLIDGAGFNGAAPVVGAGSVWSGCFSSTLQDTNAGTLTLTASPANGSTWIVTLRNCVIEDLGILANVPPGSLPIGF